MRTTKQSQILRRTPLPTQSALIGNLQVDSNTLDTSQIQESLIRLTMSSFQVHYLIVSIMKLRQAG